MSLAIFVGAIDGMEDGFAVASVIVSVLVTVTPPLNSKSVSSPTSSSIFSSNSPTSAAVCEIFSIELIKSEVFDS